MRGKPRLNSIAGVGIALIVLASCSTSRQDVINPDLPGHMQFGRDPNGKVVTTYKVGNPYKVQGLWYYPAEDFGYREEGVASWYGPGFNGKRTANGEVYDMNALTAAHKTLPIPSVVQVTNLENGRQIKLRINDRGPFVEGRIIDLSRRAAQLLDVERNGIARVRVELVPEDSLTLKNLALDANGQPSIADMPGVIAAPRGLVVAESLAPTAPPVVSVPLMDPIPTVPAPTITTTSLPPPIAARGQESSLVLAPPVTALESGVYIQAGAFTDVNNARRLEAQLSEIGTVIVAAAEIGGRIFHRVRIGPVANRTIAEQMLSDMLSQGYDGASIVED
jgi:rare lipoprotein A